MPQCKLFSENGFCPKGLNCENDHDYNSNLLENPFISKAFDIMFTYLNEARNERSKLSKEIRDVRRILIDSKGNLDRKASKNNNTTITNKALSKLDSIDERLMRVESSIRNKGLPLRAADISFHPHTLKFKHSDSSILGRGEILSGKSMLKKTPAKNPSKVKKIDRCSNKSTVKKNRIKRAPAHFMITQQDENSIPADSMDEEPPDKEFLTTSSLSSTPKLDSAQKSRPSLFKRVTSVTTPSKSNSLQQKTKSSSLFASLKLRKTR